MWMRTFCRMCGNRRKLSGITPDGQPTESPCPVCHPAGCDGCGGNKVQRRYIHGVLTATTCARCNGSGQQPPASDAPFWVDPRKAIANPVISRGEPVPSWMTPAPEGRPKK